jgi:hypothetical protein
MPALATATTDAVIWAATTAMTSGGPPGTVAERDPTCCSSPTTALPTAAGSDPARTPKLSERLGRPLVRRRSGLPIYRRSRAPTRAADSAAGSECCDAGKIPGIFVENSKHQKGSRQDRDKEQPPVAAQFLRLVHLGPGALLASTATSRPSFQWIDGAPPTKLFTARRQSRVGLKAPRYQLPTGGRGKKAGARPDPRPPPYEPACHRAHWSWLPGTLLVVAVSGCPVLSRSPWQGPGRARFPLFVHVSSAVLGRV